MTKEQMQKEIDRMNHKIELELTEIKMEVNRKIDLASLQKNGLSCRKNQF